MSAITGAFTNVTPPEVVSHDRADRQLRRHRGTPPPPDDVDNGAVPEHDADAHTGRRGWRGRIGAIGWRYTLVVFAVEILIFWIIAGDRFLTTNNLILTAQNVAVLTVMACGATFVLITAGVDLSVGSVAILGEVVAAKTIIAAGANGVVRRLPRHRRRHRRRDRSSA